jgi:hypothetical protein
MAKPGESKFSAEAMRSRALRVLAAIADPSRADLDRVLKHALKVNRVCTTQPERKIPFA